MFTITTQIWNANQPLRTRSFPTKEMADSWYDLLIVSRNYFRVVKNY